MLHPRSILLALALPVVAMLLVAGCGRDEPSSGYMPGALPLTFDGDAAHAVDPARCAACHAEAHADWKGSDHDLANRSFAPGMTGPDADALTRLRADPMLVDQAAGVLGVRPLIQFIIPAPMGAYQVHDQAWDPLAGEWFSVFGHEQRVEGEWGHWTGQGMNWNANCAYCHMTDFQKNLDVATGAYSSTWTFHGITCAQCHPGAADHTRRAEAGAKSYVETLTPVQVMESCASCHSRREELTLNRFEPGDSFHDHFRLVLPDQPGAYYPDGQVREEDYVYGSLRMSRMGAAGVTCMDCHDPHSLQVKLPVENNALCMNCHSTGLKQAPIIDPAAHSHHLPESMGNRCVECHMPATPFMARDWRRDHGFTSPDPLLTKTMAIPNACSTCHTDQTVDWALEHAQAWYGEDFNKAARARTKLLHAYESGTPLDPAAVTAQADAETNEYWRATWLRLLGQLPPDPHSVAYARQQLGDPSPVVRDAAARTASMDPAAAAALAPLLADPVRVVRVAAVSALGTDAAESRPALDDFREYLEMNADRPLSALRLAQWWRASGRLADAIALVERAVGYDSGNPSLLFEAALFYLDAQLTGKGEAAFRRAVELSPDSGYFAYQFALYHAGRDDLAQAEQWLHAALEREPAFDRAWYNLSVIAIQRGNLTEALDAIDNALRIAPQSREYGQTRAYILQQMRAPR